jgi:hypothetical protein
VGDPVERLPRLVNDESIGQTEDGDPSHGKPLVPKAVMVGRGEVMSSVEFNHERRGSTEEVGEVGTERDLPSELRVEETTTAEQLPEHALGGSGCATQLPCAECLLSPQAHATPSALASGGLLFPLYLRERGTEGVRVMTSHEPNEHGRELDEGKKVPGELLEAHRDATESLDALEEALDLPGAVRR